MKKGFTLIELLSVIALLGLLIVLIVPNVMKVIDKKSEDIYNSNINELIETTRRYLIDNPNLFDEIDSNGYIDININTLCLNNLIDCPITDPRDDSTISGVIHVINNNGSYEYSFVPSE